jgi:hypothetical protein
LTKNGQQAQTQAEILTGLAERTLSAFENIANAATTGLGQKPSGLGAMASINQATAEKVVQSLRDIHEGRELDCRKLMLEPAIARLVIADDDGNAIVASAVRPLVKVSGMKRYRQQRTSMRLN